MGSLSLRPGDLLTILKMALSIGSRSSVSFPPAIQATGFLTFTPVGLFPTEHASLSLDTRDDHKSDIRGGPLARHESACLPADR
jgi:hypothetical protein